eukprot:CAMPEP_0202962446 /NCGR_PEP_ID=MMETSP1396-20130829/6555_1 /ASSEMBLY_ACC=CAM_ASM_000872 /TAXON_ID= /ORGANISM="Pseudokeronopsis sp., Strain Brazil" /LENGTH=107 /DNA_ID=CAMNT_0049683033 /DNA_START=326 /DNA_END=649 /DNA_ORIENTATION=-
MENYSLPENLMVDMRDLLSEEDPTNYDNNNEFFAHLPISPTSTNSQPLSYLRPDEESKQASKPKVFVPMLDLTKLTQGYDPNNDYYLASEEGQSGKEKSPMKVITNY